MTADWTEHFTGLLTGRHSTTGDELDAGAQLLVIDPDGPTAFLAPLARHWRFERADPQLIWIRPILGGYVEHGAPYFNLNMARRRGLAYTDVQLNGDNIVFPLQNGQTAHVQPAVDGQLAELQRWDTFFYMALTDQETNDLTRLDSDSWHGRFA